MEMNWLRRLTGRSILVVVGLAAIAVWGVLTLLATRPAVKFVVDWSPQARFTFGEDTEDLLKQLRDTDREVRIDTFYQPLTPPTNNPDRAYMVALHRRVQGLTTDLLRVYELRGGGAVTVRHYDQLRAFQEVRQRLDELNVQVQRNCIVVSLGKRQRILSLDLDLATIDVPANRRGPNPGQTKQYPTLKTYKGEEAISSAIRSLLVEGTPHAYVLTGFRGPSITQGTANSYSELAGGLADEGFEVREWNLREHGHIPDEATVAALLEPIRDLSARDAEAMLAYVRRGGRLFLNVAFRELPVEHNPTLANLGRSLGFEIGTELIGHLVKDPNYPQALGRGGLQAQNLFAELSPHHDVTKALARAGVKPIIKAAREIRILDERPDGVYPDGSLIRTGPWAWAVPRRGQFGEVDMSAPADGRVFASRTIGAVIDVDPTVADAERGHVIVLGGVAFLNEGFRANGDLGLNIFNWLASRRELVSIRGRQYRSKRLEIAPQQVERVDRLLIWYVPGALLGFALVMFVVRRRV